MESACIENTCSQVWPVPGDASDKAAMQENAIHQHNNTCTITESLS